MTPLLSFVARLPDTFARNGKFVGAAGGRDASSRRVTFSLAAGANGEKDLILRQNPILMDMDQDEQQYPLVLARNVKDFTIEWWGTNNLDNADWNTEWDDTMTNNIPQMLRVHLVLGANTANGSSAPEFAATRIYTVPSADDAGAGAARRRRRRAGFPVCGRHLSRRAGTRTASPTATAHSTSRRDENFCRQKRIAGSPSSLRWWRSRC